MAKEKLNILLISTACAPSLYEASYGGIEGVVYNVADVLNKLGHEVTVAAPVGSEFPEGIHCFPTVILPQQVWREDVAFDLISRQSFIPNGFNVLHDFSHQHLGGRISHGCWAQPHPFLFMCWHPPYFRGMPNRISEPAYNLCGVAKHQAEGLSQIYNQEVKYAYLGVDTERYALQEDKGDRYLFLSVPNKEKGGIEAIQIARALNLNLDCICGQISQQSSDYANQMKSLCDGTQIKWLGGVPESIKIRVLQNAKGLIFPVSQDEPFGLIMPEALSVGTPVFALNRGAVPEILCYEAGVAKYGFVAGSLEMLKQGIKVYEDGGWEHLRYPKRLRERVTSMFSRELMVERFLGLYQLIMDGSFWY